jgi:SAM-dependent methyltransferase
VKPSFTVVDIFEIGMNRRVGFPIYLLGGIALNLGAGSKEIPGAMPLDLPSWNADRDPIPYPDGSVALIHAYHFLEHVERPIEVLWECQRVLRIGGVMNIVVPYYSAQIAAHDLTHKSRWTEDTWKILFRNPYYSPGGPRAWTLRETVNIIMGLVERNLVLVTQLRKES